VYRFFYIFDILGSLVIHNSISKYAQLLSHLSYVALAWVHLDLPRPLSQGFVPFCLSRASIMAPGGRDLDDF